ncbi:MAG: hypothetical protein LBG60_15670 [Bifidobacteriaceae bacterium]|nr:hypothetical protein [Bifidobacteriaceae bacterium]
MRDWLRDNPTRPDGTPLTFAEAKTRVTVHRMREGGSYRDSPSRRSAN